MDRYPVQAQEEHCSRTSWLSPPSRSSKGNFHSVSGCLLAKCAKMDTISKAGVAQSAEQRFCKPQVGGSIPLASSMRSADAGIDLKLSSFADHFESCFTEHARCL